MRFTHSFWVIVVLLHSEVNLSSGELSYNTKVVLYQLKAFWECKRQLLNYIYNNYTGCEPVFDGWNCWKNIDLDEILYLECPPFGSHQKTFEIGCTSAGEWSVKTINYNGYCNAGKPLPPIQRDVVEELADGFVTNVAPWEQSVKKGENVEIKQRDFESCLDKVLLQNATIPSNKTKYCKRTFDGWGCWYDTLAGKTASMPCPRFVTGFSANHLAHKTCLPNGTWFKRPETQVYWSNYSTCIDKSELAFRNLVNNLYVTGYSLSVVALSFSLLIFFYFRSLRCRRITIHKNLFISFVINNVAWIVWYLEVINKSDESTILQDNKLPCRILHVITQYFLVSNYFWMFCEGLYLHTLLVLAFVSEEKIMKWFYLIGWGIPFIFTLAYSLARSSDPIATKECWIEQETIYTYILSIPVCISILLSFAFLVNIVRVLVTKLNAVNSPDTDRTKKAVRATVILLPLLGLHYVLTPFRPTQDSSALFPYEIISAVVTSFQGFCVALLFCFCNGEVTAQIRKRWAQLSCVESRDDNRRISYANTSVTYLPRRISDGKIRSPSLTGPNHNHVSPQQQTLL